MTKKIAIVGSAQSTRHLAPYDDPTWEIWGLAWRFQDHPRMDVCFEIHKEKEWDGAAGQLFRSWLQDPRTLDDDRKPVTVYLHPEEAGRYKACKSYPLDKAKAVMGGREYFTSSFSYMLALAIAEKATTIGVWGVDLVIGSEYADQRPCAEFLLGVAQAKGIEIIIPDQSALLKATYVYGREDPPAPNPLRAHVAQKVAKYDEKIADLKTQLYTLSGAKHELEQMLEAIEATDRGAVGTNQ